MNELTFFLLNLIHDAGTTQRKQNKRNVKQASWVLCVYSICISDMVVLPCQAQDRHAILSFLCCALLDAAGPPRSYPSSVCVVCFSKKLYYRYIESFINILNFVAKRRTLHFEKFPIKDQHQSSIFELANTACLCMIIIFIFMVLESAKKIWFVMETLWICILCYFNDLPPPFSVDPLCAVDVSVAKCHDFESSEQHLPGVQERSAQWKTMAARTPELRQKKITGNTCRGRSRVKKNMIFEEKKKKKLRVGFQRPNRTSPCEQYCACRSSSSLSKNPNGKNFTLVVGRALSRVARKESKKG